MIDLNKIYVIAMNSCDFFANKQYFIIVLS